MSENTSWWQRLQPWVRRTIRGGALWLLAGLLAAAWGLSTASHTGSVGPHTAEYSTTLNNEITFDMGPVGALIIDSPLPLNLGVDIEVGHIPDELTIEGRTVIAGPDQAVAALTADLASYTQFLASPSEAVEAAAHGLAEDALARTVLGWSMLLTLVLLGRLAAHGVLRSAVVSAWRRPGVPAVSLTLAAVLGGLAIIPATQGSAGAGRTSEVLQGTPLADARITGRLRVLIDHYGQYVLDEIAKNEDFYDRVTDNIRAALVSDAAVRSPVNPLVPMPEVPGPVVEDPSFTEEEPARFMDAENPVTMLIVADLHCNIGMGRVAGQVADLVGAQMILNLGDNVLGGTSVEGFCIDSFADSFGDRAVIAANGNHDSDETTRQQQTHGWHVLQGDTLDVEGVRFLGDTDPTLTSLGAPTKLVDDENFDERGHRLAERACEEHDAGTPVDILMMHNHRATEEALDTGCVDYAFAGHFHRTIGPWQRGLGVQLLHTSTAGAVLNNPTIGPLHGTAGMTVMIWDRANHRPAAMRVISALPDTSVEVSPWHAWPEPARENVHLEWPTPEEAPWP